MFEHFLGNKFEQRREKDSDVLIFTGLDINKKSAIQKEPRLT